MNTIIDWETLREAARNALKNSYSPYSEYAVGCSALTQNGRIISGCNIENASYGLTMCAENSMVAELFATGGGKLVAFICLNKEEEIIMPCGRCRQLLFEHAADNLVIETPKGIATINDILPLAFSNEDLENKHEG